MSPVIRLLTYSAILTWVMIIAASVLRTRGKRAVGFRVVGMGLIASAML